MKATGKPPAGQSWVWLTHDLLESQAWRSLGINERRVIDFLLLEHMRHRGQQNGLLLAPRRQLIASGVHPSRISSAIDRLVATGLLDVRRGTGRQPSAYALNWLPRCDGNPPSERWRIEYTSVSTRNEYTSASDVVQKCTHKGRSEYTSVSTTGGTEVYSPSRISCQGEAKGPRRRQPNGRAM